MMEIKQNQREILFSFIESFVCHTQASSSILLDYSDLKVYEGIDLPGLTIKNSSDEVPITKKFDLVLGNLPLGHGADKLIESLQHIADNGYGMYLVAPMLLSSSIRNQTQQLIKDNNCYIAGILNTPTKFLDGYSSLQPVFVIISRAAHSSSFLAELKTSQQAAELASGFFNDVKGKNLTEGLWISIENFESFTKWKIANEISSLNSEYKNFENYKLNEIAVEINLCRTGDSHSAKPNSLYIPKIGTQEVTDDISNTKIKHQNYIQIVCDTNIVSTEYLVAFFQSDLGRLIRSSLLSDGWIRSVTKSAIGNASIPIPDLHVQSQITASLKKLSTISEKIASYEKILAKDPISSTNVLSQIDKVLVAVGDLADADRVKSLIREGESLTVEFKESFNLDVRKQTKEKEIRLSSIKTIAAFLNSSGGVLLIGVRDNDSIAGIDIEIEKFHKADTINKSRDKFLLDFKNALKHQIGEQFYPFIDYRFVNVDDKTVLFVECKQSPTAVYVDNKDFFVRVNPSTDKLEGPKLVEYIQNHFKGR